MKEETPIQHVVHGTSSFGERAADNLAKYAGSWTFIMAFLVFLVIWMFVNVYVLWTWSLKGDDTWDPFPFILLNLVLSCIAALQAPIILMSQNRQAKKDRRKIEYDYRVNIKSEKLIEEILDKVKNIEGKKKS